MDLKQPNELCLDGDIANNFKIWKQRFEIFMEATGIDANKDKSEERKLAILLHIIGDEVQEIFDTFEVSSEIKGDWKNVLEVLEKYFILTSKSINANAVHCDSEEKEGMFLDMICCNERKLGIIRKSCFQNVLINGCVIPCKIDTGAEANILNHSAVKKIPVDVTAPSVKFTNYNGSPITELYGEVKVKCEVNGIEDVETFQIVQLNSPCIIGLDFCVKYGLLQRCQVNSVEKSVSKSLEQLIMKYKDTFGGIGEIKNLKHRIKIRKNAEPIAEASRKIPVGVQEGLKIELERMERLGVMYQEDYLVKSQLEKRQRNYKHFYDLKNKGKPLDFEKGKNVYVKDLVHNMTPAKVIGSSQRPRSYRVRLANGNEVERNRVQLYQASSHNPVSSDDALDFDVNHVPDNQPDFVENSLQNFNNVRPSTENNPTTSRSGR